MNLFRKIWNGPYSLLGYLGVVSLATGFISGSAVYFQGWITYHGMATIPLATHLSETLFTGLLITLITGICLHWHSNRKGSCLTLFLKGHCPFLGLLVLGLALGGIATALVYFIQGKGEISYHGMLKAKAIQGFLTGFSLPFLMHALIFLRHPQVKGNENISCPVKDFEKTGTVWRYLFNLCIVTVILNLFLFPGIAWVFYHSKAFSRL